MKQPTIFAIFTSCTHFCPMYTKYNPHSLTGCPFLLCQGEVFHGSAPQRFTFREAKAYCLSHRAVLATTAQLYVAWNDGLNHCSPGWLADGSVRYPIVTPRERCGGGEPGVRTVYRYSNQTGFPEVHTKHDVYCFRSKTPPAARSVLTTLHQTRSQDPARTPSRC